MRRKNVKSLQEFKNPGGLYELANLDHLDTGLPMLVWVSEKRASHGPRIKVARTYNHRTIPGDTFSVSITNIPKVVAGDTGDITTKDVKLVFQWVILNKELLLKYWHDHIVTRELYVELKKI